MQRYASILLVKMQNVQLMSLYKTAKYSSVIGILNYRGKKFLKLKAFYLKGFSEILETPVLTGSAVKKTNKTALLYSTAKDQMFTYMASVVTWRTCKQNAESSDYRSRDCAAICGVTAGGMLEQRL